MRRLEADPRVSSVTFAMFNPGDEGSARIEAEGVAYPSQSGVKANGSAKRSETEVREVRFNRVDVDFFRVFEVPILAGRGFGPADIAGPSRQNEDSREGGAVVVNLPFAQRVFGGNALGRRIRYVDRSRGAAAQNAEPGRREAQARQGAASSWYEIVGIVSDFPTGVSQGMRNRNSEVKVYHAVAAGQVHPAAIAIRMRDGDPSLEASRCRACASRAFTPRLREIALAVDPDLHLRNIRGLDEVLRSEQWISRLQAALIVV